MPVAAPPSKQTVKQRMLRAFACDDAFERAARVGGARHIAGVDEVGRGALFGPVVAAAVVLPSECAVLMQAGLRDSKQLDPGQRERLAAIVRGCALGFAVHEVDAAAIDRINIYRATKQAMLGAVGALAPEPDHLLIDALQLPLACAQTPIVYGDARSLSIAAASVIAKVYRDARMRELDAVYPGYGLSEHKGYATPEHQRALLRLGPSGLHRRSFRPVREAALPWDTV